MGAADGGRAGVLASARARFAAVATGETAAAPPIPREAGVLRSGHA